MKRLGIAFMAAFLPATLVQAADLGWNSGTNPLYSPSPAAGWSGFYAGLNGGYGFGTIIRQPAGGGAQTSNNSGGWALGGQLGYNMDMGGFVLGAEADAQWSSIGYSEDIAGIGSFRAGTDLFGTLRGRAGIGIGAVMPYVTGGFAAARGTASVTSPLGVTTSQSATHMGWTVGGGLEAKATENITVKAEYLYVDLGTQTYNGLPVGNQDITQRFGLIRAGVNYKF